MTIRDFYRDNKKDINSLAFTVFVIFMVFFTAGFVLVFLTSGMCVVVKQPYFLFPLALAFGLTRILKRHNRLQDIVFGTIEAVTFAILLLTLIGLLCPTMIAVSTTTVNGQQVIVEESYYGVPPGYHWNGVDGVVDPSWNGSTCP